MCAATFVSNGKGAFKDLSRVPKRGAFSIWRVHCMQLSSLLCYGRACGGTRDATIYYQFEFPATHWRVLNRDKVKKILKGSLDSISSPSVKIQIQKSPILRRHSLSTAPYHIERRDGWTGGAKLAPQIFDRSINPIPTRVADAAHPLIHTDTSIFFTFRHQVVSICVCVIQSGFYKFEVRSKG